jgi:hypothetical protein
MPNTHLLLCLFFSLKKTCPCTFHVFWTLAWNFSSGVRKIKIFVFQICQRFESIRSSAGFEKIHGVVCVFENAQLELWMPQLKTCCDCVIELAITLTDSHPWHLNSASARQLAKSSSFVSDATFIVFFFFISVSCKKLRQPTKIGQSKCVPIRCLYLAT